MDPWKILPDERTKYEQQFSQLSPIDGFLTGSQSRGFLLKSNLPPAVLAKVWELSDVNRDGRLDRNEFSVAMHLIRKKLQGIELPSVLSPSILISPTIQQTSITTNAGAWGSMPDVLPRAAASPPSVLGSAGASMPGNLEYNDGGSSLASQSFPIQPNLTGPGLYQGAASNSFNQRSRTGSFPQIPVTPVAIAGVIPAGEWAIPHQIKVKYNKMFHDLDKTRMGSLSGGQARPILTQSGLPVPVLAQVWALADIDKDGRLTSEEFVLVMHLVEMAKRKEPLPAILPLELIPPSFRRPKGVSATMPINVEGAAVENSGSTSGAQQDGVFPNAPASFEDKRKENYDKGQAELERRRQAIQEMQRQEREERERRERAEQERREVLRLEQERKRQAELEERLARQRELEEKQEEERRKILELQKAARLEMDRQRKVERQKQRRHELFNERTRAYEELAHYKQESGGFEINSVDTDAKFADLLRLAEESRNQVRERKDVIDNMRGQRDQLLETISRATQDEARLTEDLRRAKTESASLAGRLSIVGDVMHDLPRLISEVETQQGKFDDASSRLSEAEIASSRTKKTIDERNEKIKSLADDFQSRYEEHTKFLHEYHNRQEVLFNTFPSTRLVNTTTITVPQSGQIEPVSDGLYPNLQPLQSAYVTPVDHYGFDATGKADTWGDQNGFEAPDDLWGEQSPFGETAEPGGVSEIRDNLRNKLVMRTPSIKHEHHLSFDNDFRKHSFKQFKASFAYTAGNEDELSFSAGDIISVPDSHEGEPGWLPGELNGKTGWLPENHVQLLQDQPEEQKFKPTPKSRGNSISTLDASAIDAAQLLTGNVKAKAIHPWNAKKESHLTFAKGDILTLKKRADNWFHGEKEVGKQGWFPAACIEMLPDTEATQRGTPTMVHGVSTEGHQHMAVFEYKSDIEGDLSFDAGDIVLVIQKDGDWWTGRIGNRSGIFPSNYVKEQEITSPSIPPASPQGRIVVHSGNEETSKEETSKRKPEIVVAVAPYTAGGQEQISFAKGDMILVKKKTETGWWEGELQAKGKQKQLGWFPAAYVKNIAASGQGSDSIVTTPTANNSRTGSFSSGSAVDSNAAALSGTKVEAMFDYAAMNDDELSFKKNDIVFIVAKEDENWWKGSLNGKVGILPSNYVHILN